MNEMMYGVYVAVVENNTLDDDAKIEITLEHVAGNHKCRARIATLMAGNERGSLFLPEKNDQVLVAFEQGMFEFPVIIGALWSRKDKPPDTNSDGNNDLKLIKTRGGNEIRVIDEKGKEKIEIVSEKGEISIMADKIILKGDVHITGTLDVGADGGFKTHINKNEIKGELS